MLLFCLIALFYAYLFPLSPLGVPVFVPLQFHQGALDHNREKWESMGLCGADPIAGEECRVAARELRMM